MRAQGQGAPQDIVRAYLWMYLSAKSGMTDAVKNIGVLDKMVSQSQKREAIAKADECSKNQFKNCD